MEHSWRPRPPTGNFCPICSNSHFPFCPPPPLPQYFTPPPPPHADQFFYRPLPPQLPPPPSLQSSYDPFVDPYPPPPPLVQRPQQYWNGDPNYNKDFYANYGLDYPDNSQIKRIRFDNSWVTAEAVAEDERRLKLIHDHGAVTHGYSQESIGVKRKYGETQIGYQPWEINKNEELDRTPYNKQSDNFTQNHVYGSYNSGHKSENFYDYEQSRGNHENQVYRNALFQEQRSNFPVERRELNGHFSQPQHHIMEPKTACYNLSNSSEGMAPQKLFKYQPPLPNSPPPPLPMELTGFRPVVSSSKSQPSSLFPVAANSPPSLQSPYTVVSQANASVYTHYSSKANPKSSVHYEEEIHAIQTTSSNRNLSPNKPNIIDASLILKHPHRSSRPDHIVIILRGLPGSGKSYLAKILRDLEVENGGDAPRIYSMDEYFMTEVERVDESESSKSSGSARGKRTVTKKVMEYFYEPEMEEAYRSSMLKAFKKTLDEGVFSFVIVDDRNPRVADFAQFWATAKRSGYEVYLLEATYKDPAGCAARNVHSFTLDDIQKMTNQWEEAPSLYMKLDIKSLLHGDGLHENGIEEVDMDTEDDCHIGNICGSENTNSATVRRPSEGDLVTDGRSNDEYKWDAVEERPIEVVKDLGKSKWSSDLDEDDAYKTKVTKKNTSALFGIVKAYSKRGKSVCWADQVGRVGFSIGGGTTADVSLVTGPGSGYNLKSNPLPDEEKVLTHRRSGESRKQNIFQEQLRAERESFKAVFDKRRQRIMGRLDLDKE